MFLVQGKRLIAVAAAKRHMVVMSSEGDIYTWGHRVVTPRRVQLAGKQCTEAEVPIPQYAPIHRLEC